jgi:outer membrane lipopolysaccharide assembly protein LptE/RlpB
MRTRRLSRRLAALALACTFLAACGSRMRGHYKNPNDLMEVEFKSGNTAYPSMIGTTVEVKYRIDGDHIVFDTPRGSWCSRKTPTARSKARASC